MRIGIFVHAYQPEAGGGYTFERDILESLVELLPESHHKFTAFSPNPSTELIKFLAKSPNINFNSIERSASIPAKLFRRVRKLWDWHGKHLSDLSDAAEELGMEFIWFITPVYQPVNIPYIITIWDLQHRLQPWFPEVGALQEWQLREGIYSDLIQRASYVITGTKAGQDEISFFYQIPKERIRILPLPAPSFAAKIIENQVQTVLEKYQLSTGFLLYPAQFWPHKNHANLLLALKILHDKYNTSLDLVLVGSEKGNKEYIHGFAKELGIEKKVHILGFVSREELIALYQSAFALTYMTFFGPENLPPLEAFGIGCPVIASLVQGSEEQLGNAAILVDPRNPDAIADAVKSLMDNPVMRTELIERGYQRASRWMAKEFVRSVITILNEFESIRRSWK
jgi:glycosyltransferase involved in cell wall biosynthesis